MYMFYRLKCNSECILKSAAIFRIFKKNVKIPVGMVSNWLILIPFKSFFPISKGLCTSDMLQMWLNGHRICDKISQFSYYFEASDFGGRKNTSPDNAPQELNTFYVVSHSLM